jgi:hypothetical protein
MEPLWGELQQRLVPLSSVVFVVVVVVVVQESIVFTLTQICLI